MINPLAFLDALKKASIDFISGVPDSLLKDFCACISDSNLANQHIIASSEGAAIGMAIGHYLSSGNIGLVYMQNSGLGNSLNPIVSLADPNVYGIPMLLLIGWRGEVMLNGELMEDEPQHIKQGEITPALLDVMGIPYFVLNSETNNLTEEIKTAKERALNRSGPVALLARRGAFSQYSGNKAATPKRTLTREAAIAEVVEALPQSIPIIATTGMASRELFELRETRRESHDGDFLTVGGMGHAISVAAGVAMGFPEKVVCLDGDGACIMHAGSLSTSAQLKNIIHILINNGVHDSVGGQPTSSPGLNFKKIAKEFGYGLTLEATTESEIRGVIREAVSFNNSIFIEIHCSPGNRKNLGRPNKSPRTNRDEFMKFMMER